MGVYFYDGGILFDSGDIAFHEDCCCGEYPCTYCQSGTTPEAINVTLPTFTAGNCSAAKCAACSGATFRCVQWNQSYPCSYSYGDTGCFGGSGYCPTFTLSMSITSTFVTITLAGSDNTDPGYNVILWRVSHTSGATCNFSSLPVPHLSGGAVGKPCYTSGDCTITSV